MKITLNEILVVNDRFTAPKTLKEKLTGRSSATNLVEMDIIGDIQFSNYLQYLELCYNNHFGAVITPDIIWYSILCEVTEYVKENVERVRRLFTTSQDKQEITVQTDSLTRLPLSAVINALSSKVPTNIDSFLPTFTTTDDRSRLAMYSAFCDAASPYYNYSMMLCGIPYVILKGTKEDWIKLLNAWKDLPSEIFENDTKYENTVTNILENILASFDSIDTTFWNSIFTNKRCGSGHQFEVNGWFTQLYRKQPNYPKYASNYGSHLSMVDYKNLSTGKKYKMYSGILGADLLEDSTLVPNFGNYIIEVPTPINDGYKIDVAN